MDETLGLERIIRFGGYEVDVQAGELRKRGLRLRLQDKPFRILAALLERPGEIVPRKELHARLWPDTFVGFDRSLNTAVYKLRQVLGDVADNPRFVETVSRRGFRFIPSVQVGDWEGGRRLKSGAPIDSIAVLPFQNAGGNPEVEYLSDGLAEGLINCFSQMSEVRVMARSTMFRFKGRDMDPQAVGRSLNTQAVLAGRVVPQADGVIVDVELVDVENGWRLWGEQYSRALSAVITLQEEMCQQISEKLRWRLTGEEKERLGKRYTDNAEAYHDYLKGSYQFNKMTEEGMQKGLAYFQQAIQKDPGYALAYAGMGGTYCRFAFFSLHPPKEVLPKAKEAALKALEIDATLPEAHAALASVKKIYDWDWQVAEREYRLALQLNPNYAAAHHGYADYLSALGRRAEALQEIRRAEELDPLSLVFRNEVAWNLYMARDYSSATGHLLKTIEMEAGFAAAHHTIGLVYEQTGRYDEAIAALEKSREGSGGNPATLAGLSHVFAVAGRKREAKKILTELKKAFEKRYLAPYWLAIVYAGLDEKDAAFEWLEKAYEERDVWLVWAKVEPRFDNLQSDPRFPKFLHRLGLLP